MTNYVAKLIQVMVVKLIVLILGIVLLALLIGALVVPDKPVMINKLVPQDCPQDWTCCGKYPDVKDKWIELFSEGDAKQTVMSICRRETC